eukprot:CAMPEP_0185159516 /NCGR_PEP_ID=MMETSP1139-20130426/3095_1 /TAXON_ID=298111 /ORGANISM="Pavlova sp., Strain CCMP459" /LENGTH=100 /DNA_ID=CAMNT_0027724689 /DNA_START=658 /DNA_END=956 /DNA_ORIENTATION=+
MSIFSRSRLFSSFNLTTSSSAAPSRALPAATAPGFGWPPPTWSSWRHFEPSKVRAPISEPKARCTGCSFFTSGLRGSVSGACAAGLAAAADFLRPNMSGG